MTVSPSIKKTLRLIMVAQCVGMISSVLFGNGFMLAFLSRLGVPDYRILFLFALLPFLNMLLTLPLSQWADRTGKKRIGGCGNAISVVGLLLLIAAPFDPERAMYWLATGTIIYSIGNAAGSATWFALLSPIVPEEIRGRWFGQMRTAWQTTAILFSLAVAALLKSNTSLPLFQSVLLLCAILLAGRLIIYIRLPELEPIAPTHCGFRPALLNILRNPGYLPFSMYCFIIAFLTGSLPGLLGLLEKQVLHFNDSELVLMGNLLAGGMIIGFLLGGKSVDRVGSRPVFAAGHILFTLTLSGVLLRDVIPLPLTSTMGVLSFLFGATQGAVGIACTSDLFALIPKENKALSTGFNITLINAGMSFSGLLSGQLIKSGRLPAGWCLFENPMSAYDSLLVGLACLTALLIFSKKLSPNIRTLKHQWLPQSR